MNSKMSKQFTQNMSLTLIWHKKMIKLGLEFKKVHFTSLKHGAKNALYNQDIFYQLGFYTDLGTEK